MMRIPFVYRTELALWAAVNALCFVGTQASRVLAMRHLSANETYTISKAGVVLVLLWGACVRHEHPGPGAKGGIILSLLALGLFMGPRSEKDAAGQRRTTGICYAALSALLSAGTAISLKQALHGSALGEQLSFTILGYALLVVLQGRPAQHAVRPTFRMWRLGIILGGILFVGFMALSAAYRSGHLIIVSMLHGNATVLATLMLWVHNPVDSLAGEPRDRRQVAAVLLCVLATVAFALER